MAQEANTGIKDVEKLAQRHIKTYTEEKRQRQQTGTATIREQSINDNKQRAYPPLDCCFLVLLAPCFGHCYRLSWLLHVQELQMPQ
jgi:hypothetical protein